MAKQTLLEMVQDILASINSDNVNSISDTVESDQVAKIVKNKYYSIITVLRPPEHEKVTQLQSVSDVTKPNCLDIPDSVSEMFWIKYNWASNSDPYDYRDVTLLPPEDFLNYIERRNSNISGFVEVTTDTSIVLQILNNIGPHYWTTFDDSRVWFDSWNESNESTMESRNSLIKALSEPSFSMTDTFVPDLDSNLFPYLLAESKSQAFIDIKQMPNPKHEQEAKDQKFHVSHNLWRANQRKPYNRLPDYGRRPC